MLPSECDEKYVILPDGRLEKDETGVIPGNCEMDQLSEGDLQRVVVSALKRTFPAGVAVVESLTPNQWSEYLTLGRNWHYPEGSDGNVLPPPDMDRYWSMRLDGQSHNMAFMLATKSFPGVKTDAIFNEGRCNGNQFEATPAQGDWLRRQADAAGVSTTGKTYLSGLASFPGDPSAWVSDRHDVVAVAKAKGLNVDGYVTHRESHRGPDLSGDAFTVADKLVKSEAREVCAANPGADFEAVCDRVREVRSGKADLSPALTEGE